MNINIVKFFAIVGALLSVLILTEWIISKFAENSLLESNFSNKRQAPLSNEIPGINLKEKSEESYADFVNRPLFIKGRRPVETSPEQADFKPGSDIFDWQLNGVYTTDQGLSALFSRTRATKDAKDKFRKLKENDDLDGWKLAEILKDKVILKQDGETKELLLSKPKPKELKTPVPAKRPFEKVIGKLKQNQAGSPQSRNDKNKKSETQSQPAENSSENSDNEE
ncbi:MAG: hypothetical protein ACU84H_05435 [Gammaproteobacteria bacterium]